MSSRSPPVAKARGNRVTKEKNRDRIMGVGAINIERSKNQKVNTLDRSDISFEEGQSSRITRSMSRAFRENEKKNGENSNDSLRERFPGYTNTGAMARTTVTSKKHTRETFISRHTQVNRLKYKPMVEESSSEDEEIVESTFSTFSSGVSGSPLRKSPIIHKTPKKTPGIGQRLVSSIVTHTPQWIRGSFSTSQPTRTIYRDSPHTNREEAADDEINDDASNTLYMMAGRYHLESGDKAAVNLVKNSDGEVEYGSESSDDSDKEVDAKSWQPGVASFGQHKSVPKPKSNIPVDLGDDMDYDSEQKRDKIYQQVGNTRDQLVDKAYNRAHIAKEELYSHANIAREEIYNQANIAKKGIYNRAHSALNKLDEAKEKIYSQARDVQDQVASKAYDARNRIVNKAQDTWEKGYQIIDRVKAKIPQPTDISRPSFEFNHPEEEADQIVEDDKSTDAVVSPEVAEPYVDSHKPDPKSPSVEEVEAKKIGVPRLARVFMAKGRLHNVPTAVDLHAFFAST
ncbi:hypothetical protein K493DRAFT_352002 [Basidiobolus meristosporus CBS 931.73]|uniref:Uncharacterized protein n=1 Tax=Basidiobolus meristosporus CBS 931.73 TaxID=1314790 RepID=A0A1Y1YAH0_9FUNG|nr:hypothetical protein K493DRAFT_352002 [Basidiobolus meristosporus CBS 931.73]|eukprot:ORX94978.1 hypothetical protein K493DRAFT_352002 [Basidiobolus meristosporus CBS 931.73]